MVERCPPSGSTRSWVWLLWSGRVEDLPDGARVSERTYLCDAVLLTHHTTPMLSFREIVLPSSAYSTLTSIIDDHDALDLLDILHSASDEKSPAFAYAHKTDMYQAARHVHFVCVASCSLVPLLLRGLEREINKVPIGHTILFRDNTSVTRAMDFAMRWYGRGWLNESLGQVVRRLVAEKVQVETDPTKMEKKSGRDGLALSDGSGLAKDLDANVRALVYWCEQIWTSVVNARGQCPKWVP